MKSKTSKTLVLVAIAIALVVVTVFTTIAFLASSSAVSNTFSVGNIHMSIYESKVDADGKAVTYDEGVRKDSTGNNYTLIPGKTYDKDPTIYVEPKSVKSFLFVKLRNQIETIEYGNYSATDEIEPNSDEKKLTIKEQMARHGWQLVGSNDSGEVYVYSGNLDQSVALSSDKLAAIKDESNFAEATLISGSENVQTFDVFDTFTVDNKADNLQIYLGAKVAVTAFSIQSSGIVANDQSDTANRDEVIAAWNAVVEEFPFESGAITTAAD